MFVLLELPFAADRLLCGFRPRTHCGFEPGALINTLVLRAAAEISRQVSSFDRHAFGDAIAARLALGVARDHHRLAIRGR